MYDVKGRFILKQIKEDESKFKLCKIKRKEVGPNKIPYIVTHDARTIRYPHPDIDVNDTVKIDLLKGEISEFVKFEPGNLAYCVAGNNIGRVGTIQHTELHPGSFNIVHIKDANQRFHWFLLFYYFLEPSPPEWETLWLSEKEKNHG